MASEFTRNIKNLTKEQVHGQEIKEFTDVNDLVSSKDNKNYIKKPDETMHCLTDNVKTINTTNALLSVTQDKENNVATLTVNHDPKREQVLKSTSGTISISKGFDGVNDEKTDINVNPLTKVIYTGKNSSTNKLVYIKDELNKIIDIFTIGLITPDSTDNGISLVEFNSNINESQVILGDSDIKIEGNLIQFKLPTGSNYKIYENNGYIYRVYTNTTGSRPHPNMAAPQ